MNFSYLLTVATSLFVFSMLSALEAFATPVPKAGVPGLHVRLLGIDKTASQFLDNVKDLCPKLLNQPWNVQGAPLSLDELIVDRYFSEDGNFMAEYSEGHTFKQLSPCSVVIVPFKKIKIYDLGDWILREYDDSAKRPGWRQRRIPGLGVAQSSFGLIHGATSAQGASISRGGVSSYAGYLCDVYVWSKPGGGSISSCDWSPPKTRHIVPKQINLNTETKDASGKVINSLTAQEFDAEIRIPASVFDPPA